MLSRFQWVVVACSLLVGCGVLIWLQSDRAPADDAILLCAESDSDVFNTLQLVAGTRGLTHRGGLLYGVRYHLESDLTAVLSSDSDVDCASLNVWQVARMIRAGNDPVVLATLVETDRPVELVTTSESGVTSDPASLRGKRIAVQPGGVGERYLETRLAQGSMTLADVEIVHGAAGQCGRLLLHGDVQLAIVPVPVASRIRRQAAALQPPVAIETFTETQIHRRNLVTTRDRLEENRDEFRQFLTALIDASELVAFDRAAAHQVMLQRFRLQADDVDEHLSAASFDVHLNVPEMESLLREELADSSNGPVRGDRATELSECFDPSALRAVDPARVLEWSI